MIDDIDFDLTKYKFIAGTDEAGRGPLAGNVVAAAVILDAEKPIHGLNDSKKLSEKKRLMLEPEIKAKVLAYAVISISPAIIDEINILQASLLAMKQAIEALSVKADFALIDGNKLPELSIPAEAIVKGDSRVAAIAAASILAKVERDRQMLAMHEVYPQYAFDKHKGYPTKLHMQLLQEHGACVEHRRSFAPVRRVLLGE